MLSFNQKYQLGQLERIAPDLYEASARDLVRWPHLAGVILGRDMKKALVRLAQERVSPQSPAPVENLMAPPSNGSNADVSNWNVFLQLLEAANQGENVLPGPGQTRTVWRSGKLSIEVWRRSREESICLIFRKSKYRYIISDPVARLERDRAHRSGAYVGMWKEAMEGSRNYRAWIEEIRSCCVPEPTQPQPQRNGNGRGASCLRCGLNWRQCMCADPKL